MTSDFVKLLTVVKWFHSFDSWISCFVRSLISGTYFPFLLVLFFSPYCSFVIDFINDGEDFCFRLSIHFCMFAYHIVFMQFYISCINWSRAISIFFVNTIVFWYITSFNLPILNLVFVFIKSAMVRFTFLFLLLFMLFTDWVVYLEASFVDP